MGQELNNLFHIQSEIFKYKNMQKRTLKNRVEIEVNDNKPNVKEKQATAESLKRLGKKVLLEPSEYTLDLMTQ